MGLEDIILDLRGASALVSALGGTHGLGEDANFTSHYAIEKIIDKAIEDLTALGK